MAYSATAIDVSQSLLIMNELETSRCIISSGAASGYMSSAHFLTT